MVEGRSDAEVIEEIKDEMVYLWNEGYNAADARRILESRYGEEMIRDEDNLVVKAQKELTADRRQQQANARRKQVTKAV